MQVNRAEGRSVTAVARRKQIVAATVEVLADVGFQGTSYARIAARAGLSSTRLISYHFAGKDELLLEVARSVYAAGAAYVQPRVAAEHTAAAMLAAYLRANLEFLRDHATELAALTEILLNLRTGDGVLRFAGGREGIAAMLEDLEAILRRGQTAGEFRDFDTRTMAWLVRNAVDGVGQQRALDPGFDFDTCIRELTTTFARATSRTGRR